ncbi:tRNA lysidine(34) synthetase TilS [bacterium]|nr:tRNA lysidine(34) synthetase TilS [bacterium]MBU1956858.1 tRNA lysidine(34) synthetase TilS [bacterium]
MLYLDESTLDLLKNSKNLLAFSAGVDSSALFFLLLEYNIPFDIALVNYGLRKQSIQEEEYALTLAKKYNLFIYIQKAPTFQKNFEKYARDFRYDFFDKLIQQHHYNNLITAHQLNDQIEWLLMRLCKGAGTTELLGLENISKRKAYTLVRPILHHAKDELITYLKSNNQHYFIDQSNADEKYERNYFRNNFSDKLIEHYKEGIQKSLTYLKEDKAYLMSAYREIFHYKELYILETDNPNIAVRAVDIYLKKLGYLLSSAQRAELKENNSMVIGGLWAIEIVENKIYIAPFQKVVMPKKFKEQCRTLKIPAKVRSYIYNEGLDPKVLETSF